MRLRPLLTTLLLATSQREAKITEKANRLLRETMGKPTTQPLTEVRMALMELQLRLLSWMQSLLTALMRRLHSPS